MISKKVLRALSHGVGELRGLSQVNWPPPHSLISIPSRVAIEAHVEFGFSEDVILKDFCDGQGLGAAELNVCLHPLAAVDSHCRGLLPGHTGLLTGSGLSVPAAH